MHSSGKKKDKHNQDVIVIDEYKVLYKLKHKVGDPINYP